jgi:hypothetical protein
MNQKEIYTTLIYAFKQYKEAGKFVFVKHLKENFEVGDTFFYEQFHFINTVIRVYFASAAYQTCCLFKRKYC